MMPGSPAGCDAQDRHAARHIAIQDDMRPMRVHSHFRPDLGLNRSNARLVGNEFERNLEARHIVRGVHAPELLSSVFVDCFEVSFGALR